MPRLRIDPGSTRLAFFLIAALAALMVLSAVIPQRDLAEDQILDWRSVLGDGYRVIEWLRLDRIYFSPPFFVLLGLLAVNLVVGNVRRFRTVFRVERTLLKARHIGSIVFHFSLLLIISGVVLNYLYKFQGIFGLTEGQTVQDDANRYYRVFTGPLYDDDYGRFEIELEEVRDMRETGGPGGSREARIVLRGFPGPVARTETISINRPLLVSGLEFHFGPRTGYSPELSVVDEEGLRIFRKFVRLSSRRLDGHPTHEDFVMLPGDRLRARLSVVPDSIRAWGPERRLTVESGSELLFDGAVAPDDTVTVGDLRFAIPRLRRWCYVDVVKSPFLGLVFTGFWAALGGLAISTVARVGRPRGRAT